MDKFTSKAPPDWYTPQELDEIERRTRQQLIHDRAIEALEIKPGMSDYVLRQILHYAEEVKGERREPGD